METNIYKKPLVIFVHGFCSKKKCWDSLISVLKKDAEVSNLFEFECFEYTTKLVLFSLFRRIPPISEIAQLLHDFIDKPKFAGRELTLIGHSMGGLVILNYLAEMLKDPDKRPSIRQVILIATPLQGSALFATIRKLIFSVFKNPQDLILWRFNQQINEIVTDVQKYITDAQVGQPNAWPIPLLCFYGLQDKIVPKQSACGPFKNTRPLDYDHFSVIRPDSETGDNYTSLRNALLVPMGSSTVFEIDRFEWTISVQPMREKQTKSVKYGNETHSIEYNNIGTINQCVTFSDGNNCKLLFQLRYRTRTGIFVNLKKLSGPPNEALIEEKARYDDDGREFIYKFTPKSGQTYFLELEVYEGFKKNNRSVMVPIPRHAYYKTVQFKLNLKHYLDTGYKFSKSPPELYVDTSQEICGWPAPPTAKLVKEATKKQPDVWEWELNNFSGGAFYLGWEKALLDTNDTERQVTGESSVDKTI